MSEGVITGIKKPFQNELLIAVLVETRVSFKTPVINLIHFKES